MTIKLRGGYNIRMTGRPAGRVDVPAEPELLLLPQRSRRLRFNQVLVKNGQKVRCGDVLAIDSAHFGVPLLSPRDGTIRLRVHRGHIAIESPAVAPPQVPPTETDDRSQDSRRKALVDLGAWPFLSDVHTDAVPDPAQPADAAIVAVTRLEPFAGPRGDVLLGQSFDDFLRGLDLLVTLVQETVYVAVPGVRGKLAKRLRETLSGKPRIRAVNIPLRYPMDHFSVLARALGVAPQRGRSIWGLRAEGVLAIDQALTSRQPLLERLIAIGGPGAAEPVHLRVPLGYPLDALLAGRVIGQPQRVIDGGILNGEATGPRQLGIGVETTGLTVLPEPTRRELFGFVRTGLDRISYSNCFLSVLRPRYDEPLTTAMRGEHRPCIGCGFCEEVCPAGIMPHWIHKLAYQDALEEIDRSGSHLCVACGLCSYVCPSKLDLRQEILDANEAIRRDLHAAEPDENEEVVA
ncbi:MAG: 4Fe-4S dicluster domain-containing protein [Thermoguttaceae bacterium]|jgi:Na+-transporting NADH:ubiquinone oxidoreductase subunit A|nr:4Fe-4S dicluster domain-containing protein [Thermoguttaceae bacterium]